MSATIPDRHILIAIDTSMTWRTEVIRGIDEFARTVPGWFLHVEARPGADGLAGIRSWAGHGVIARITQPEIARAVQRLRMPAVNVSWSQVPRRPIPQVISDEDAVGRLAARHLAGLGFRRFAYCGLPSQTCYTDRVEPAFVDELRKLGHRVAHFKPPRASKFAWKYVTIPNLRSWLRALPKPLGILAWEPERGRSIMDACRAEGIAVPDEVAVVTTADDELYCRISHPPLSAVDEKPREIGFRAAELLARLIAGRKPPKHPLLIAPQRVISRLSTDVIAIDDPTVAQAVRYIWQHYAHPIGVPDVVAAVSMSRRALELRFQQTLGRSPAGEIRRVRLARATELLAETDWPISRIVTEAGFGRVEVMNRVFRRELGQTPGSYRKSQG